MPDQSTAVTLSVPWDKTAFVETNRLRWDLAQKSVKRNMLIYGIGLIIFVPWAVFQFILHPHFNLLMLPALLFVVFEGYLVLFWVFQKRRLFRRVNSIADHLDRERMDMSYTITESGVVYRDKEETVEMPWKDLHAYALYKSYIVLWRTDTSLDTAFFIGRDPSVSQLEWDAFVRAVAEKLPEKAIRENVTARSRHTEILDSE